MRHLIINDTHGYNPCFAKPLNFTEWSTLNFIFNTHEWLPSNICLNQSTNFKNEYIFEAISTRGTLVLTNFTIEHLVIKYPLVRITGDEGYPADFECVNCRFINVTFNPEKPVFYVQGGITFDSVHFSQIKTSKEIFHAYGQDGYVDVNVKTSIFTNIYAGAIIYAYV